MNLQMIAMPTYEAREAFHAYRKAVRERHNVEDEVLMRGYSAIARGKKVISLPSVIASGGEHEASHLPKLAVMRADRRECFVRRERDGRLRFAHEQSWIRANASRTLVIDFPRRTMPALPWSQNTPDQYTGHALVPMIPPWARPHGDLSLYHILWEADWRVVPSDPALLRHIAGPFYALLATWDLTPLEREVLGMRQQ